MSDIVGRVAEAIRLRSCERGYPVHPNVARHLAAAALEAVREQLADTADRYSYEAAQAILTICRTPAVAQAQDKAAT